MDAKEFRCTYLQFPKRNINKNIIVDRIVYSSRPNVRHQKQQPNFILNIILQFSTTINVSLLMNKKKKKRKEENMRINEITKSRPLIWMHDYEVIVYYKFVYRKINVLLLHSILRTSMFTTIFSLNKSNKMKSESEIHQTSILIETK